MLSGASLLLKYRSVDPQNVLGSMTLMSHPPNRGSHWRNCFIPSLVMEFLLDILTGSFRPSVWVGEKERAKISCF